MFTITINSSTMGPGMTRVSWFNLIAPNHAFMPATSNNPKRSLKQSGDNVVSVYVLFCFVRNFAPRLKVREIMLIELFFHILRAFVVNFCEQVSNHVTYVMHKVQEYSGTRHLIIHVVSGITMCLKSNTYRVNTLRNKFYNYKFIIYQSYLYISVSILL